MEIGEGIMKFSGKVKEREGKKKVLFFLMDDWMVLFIHLVI